MASLARLAIIPARGGSKGLLRKNVIPLRNKPLIAYTIAAAKESRLISDTIVTTDDPEVKRIAQAMGVTIVDRPAELASDTARMEDVVRHALEWVTHQSAAPKSFVLLQPTSPLRTARHIDEALALFDRTSAASVVSVCEPDHHPYKYFVGEPEGLQPLFMDEYLSMPRQKLPLVYRQNGAIYCVDTAAFLKKPAFYIRPSIPYVMRPEESVDVDCLMDFRTCEMLLKKASEDDKRLIEGQSTHVTEDSF